MRIQKGTKSKYNYDAASDRKRERFMEKTETIHIPGVLPMEPIVGIWKLKQKNPENMIPYPTQKIESNNTSPKEIHILGVLPMVRIWNPKQKNPENMNPYLAQKLNQTTPKTLKINYFLFFLPWQWWGQVGISTTPSRPFWIWRSLLHLFKIFLSFLNPTPGSFFSWACMYSWYFLQNFIFHTHHLWSYTMQKGLSPYRCSADKTSTKRPWILRPLRFYAFCYNGFLATKGEFNSKLWNHREKVNLWEVSPRGRHPLAGSLHLCFV